MKKDAFLKLELESGDEIEVDFHDGRFKGINSLKANLMTVKEGARELLISTSDEKIRDKLLKETAEKLEAEFIYIDSLTISMFLNIEHINVKRA